jgi:hypothetical protein
MAYLLDSDVFIQAKNLHYGFDFCPGFWGSQGQIDSGQAELGGPETYFPQAQKKQREEVKMRSSPPSPSWRPIAGSHGH